MIPKRLIFCNFGSMIFRPDIELKCIDSWKRFFPKDEWEWIMLNEATFDIQANDYTRNCYRKKLYAYVSDFARVKELVERGGVYVDTDYYAMQALDESVLQRSCFFGSSSISTDVKDNTDMISWGIVGCEPGNAFMYQLLEMFDDGHDATRAKSCLMRNTKFLLRNFCGFTHKDIRQLKQPTTNGGVTIYPFDIFTCAFWTTSQTQITECTRGVHLYTGSWRTDKVRISSLDERLAAIRSKS